MAEVLYTTADAQRRSMCLCADRFLPNDSKVLGPRGGTLRCLVSFGTVLLVCEMASKQCWGSRIS